MHSKDYEILISRLVKENNKLRDLEQKYMAEGNEQMIKVSKIAHSHNDETIRFIKRLDKEIYKDKNLFEIV